MEQEIIINRWDGNGREIGREAPSQETLRNRWSSYTEWMQWSGHFEVGHKESTHTHAYIFRISYYTQEYILWSKNKEHTTAVTQYGSHLKLSMYGDEILLGCCCWCALCMLILFFVHIKNRSFWSPMRPYLLVAHRTQAGCFALSVSTYTVRPTPHRRWGGNTNKCLSGFTCLRRGSRATPPLASSLTAPFFGVAAVWVAKNAGSCMFSSGVFHVVVYLLCDSRGTQFTSRHLTYTPVTDRT